METEITPTIIFVCILFLCISLIVVCYTFFASKKVTNSELEKKQLELEYQEQLLNQTLLTQEKERKRIAQDIHDEISGIMNLMNLQVQLLKNTFESGSEADIFIGNIYRQGVLISENSRRIAHNLLPPIMESFGLEAALLEYMDQVNKTSAIKVELQSDADTSILPSEYQLHIFRIVQELISNSIRHGAASEAKFNINSDREIYRCLYADNGKGSVMMPQKKLGLGMQNIKSRIQFMKGKMAMFSEPSKGFNLSFEFLWK